MRNACTRNVILHHWTPTEPRGKQKRDFFARRLINYNSATTSETLFPPFFRSFEFFSKRWKFDTRRPIDVFKIITVALTLCWENKLGSPWFGLRNNGASSSSVYARFNEKTARRCVCRNLYRVAVVRSLRNKNNNNKRRSSMERKKKKKETKRKESMEYRTRPCHIVFVVRDFHF